MDNEQGDTLEPQWRWREGAVDERADHLLLIYAPLELPVALVGPHVEGTFPVRFLDQRNEDDRATARDAVQRELDFYLLDVGKPDPWNYAIYHCRTMSNAYSDVHWSWHPAGGTEETRS
jgi:hypothetical protein